MTTKQWGISNDYPFTSLETAQGRKFDAVRDYALLGAPLQARFAGLAVMGYRLIISFKFKDANGQPIHATDITAGKWDNQIRQIAAQAISWASTGHGKHIVVFQHEADSTASTVSGTYAEEDAAIAHAMDVCRSVIGWNCKLGFVLVGWAISTRAHSFPLSMASCDFVGIDPYNMKTGDPSTWDSLDSVAGPEVDFLSTYYPTKRIFFGEWGSYPDPTHGDGRAKWIAAGVQALTSPRYKNVVAVCYWNNGFARTDNVPNDVVGFSTAARAVLTSH